MSRRDWETSQYVGRPSLSPVVGALAAAGVFRIRDRILDVGAGRGTDAIALARMGFRRIDALDVNADAIAAGKRRAKRLGVEDAIAWRRGDAMELEAHYGRGVFDAIVDTLFVNNLRDDEVHAYLAQAARVLKKGGLLVLQSKVWPAELGSAEDGIPRTALRAFRESGRFGTHYAEATGRHARHIPVVVRVLRKT